MKIEIPLIVPEPGMVIEIYNRKCRFNFLMGFCRGVVLFETRIALVKGFRRRSDPAMTVCWAEPHEFGIHPPTRFAYGFVPEVEWMNQFRQGGAQE